MNWFCGNKLTSVFAGRWKLYNGASLSLATMIIAGWIAIVLEIVLLLIWVYSIFFTNQTDPAGQGMAMGFVLALCIYIGVGVLFMWMQKTWSMILVLIMAAIPLSIVVIGLWKEYGTKRKY